ncbi:hypothetical protein MMC25_004479 [Agyrium rufum]|nr:hypothetical protein [Agyrium rufum]
MKSLILTILPIVTLTFATPTRVAAPVPAPVAASVVPSFTPTGREYYLKSVDYPGNTTDKANLYLQGYHTGAGFNDVVLVPESVGSLAKFFLNNTHQEADLGSAFPWGLVLGNDDNYAGWELVQLNAGYGDSGFYFNNTDGLFNAVAGAQGLKFNSAYQYGEGIKFNEFGGWLVCDWYHGLPQLFWRVTPYDDAFPSSCALIQLERQYI